MELFLPHTQEYMVMKILAIDLGKYKSVACNYVTATGTARFATVVTHAKEFDRLLSQESPDLVVIETCSIANLGTRSVLPAGREVSGRQSQWRSLEVEERKTQDRS